MRFLVGSTLCVLTALSGQAQTNSPSIQRLPHDPGKILEAAAPYYNFSDPSLKPWHLTAAYQLYDDKGNPTEKGTYEYWWVSPQVSRSTWTRPSATYTEWHTADGKDYVESRGSPIGFFEAKLQSDLVSPIPSAFRHDPATFRLGRKDVKLATAEFPCVTIGVANLPDGSPSRAATTLCFEPQSAIPMLRFANSLGVVTTEFNRIQKIQGHFLPFDVRSMVGPRTVLSATVDQFDFLRASDSALTPSRDAIAGYTPEVSLPYGVVPGHLIKGSSPPHQERDGMRGEVALWATIDADGRVSNAQIIVSPSPNLSSSAIDAVSHWEFQPYTLHGQPIAVKTTIFFVYGSRE